MSAPVDATLFTDDLAALRGGRCAACDASMFPTRRGCPVCGAGDVRDVALSTVGTLWTFTVLHARPPGYEGPCPYALGVVELAERIRLTTLVVTDDLGALRIGDELSFTTVEVGTPDAPRTTFAYARREGAAR